MKKNDSFLYEKAVRYLSALILEHIGDPAYRLPTDAELSRRLGISRITAQKAFGILEKSGALYRIKGRGSFISEHADPDRLRAATSEGFKPRKYKIAAIFPQADSHHIQRIIGGLLDDADDVELFIANSSHDQHKESSLITGFISQGFDGLIVYPVDTEFYNETLVNLSTKNFPIVLVDRFLNGLRLYHVSSDHDEMVTLAVQRLIGNGHRHILLFNSNFYDNATLHLRTESFNKNISRARGATGYVYSFTEKRGTSQEECGAELVAYLVSHPEITGVVAVDYASSCFFRRLGTDIRQVGRDCETVYLDIYSSDLLLSTSHPAFVEQNSYGIGKTALELLIKRIKNRPVDDRDIYLPVKLF